MIILWIVGGLLLFIAAMWAYIRFTDPTTIDAEAEEEVETESPGERERILFEEQRQLSEARREEIEDGYSQQ